MLRKIAAIVLALTLTGGIIICSVQAQELSAVAQTIPNTQDYEINAKGAVVIDAFTGRVLFAQNANLRLSMASTTKIMSALIALEQENLDEYFTVDPQAIKVEGSSMGLLEGDQVSLSALAYGMLLPSGNDGANVAAVRIAGSKEAFANLMNERAAEIGMEDSHFVTPSGLDDPQHYSSAYDMALLAREALKNSRFADICSQNKAVVQYGNPPYNRWLQNHNRLLRSYEGTVGVKTGFTEKSGRCLVSCAMRSGVKLIVVTLGCSDDWNTHAKLYDRYFERLTPTDVDSAIPQMDIPVVGGESLSVRAAYDPLAQISLLDGEGITAKIVLRPLLFAPIQAGEVVGRAMLYSDGQLLSEITLTAQKTVPSREEKENSLIGFFQELIGF